jgi:anti-sigma factor RsiW
MPCDTWRAKVDVYVDGELATADAAAFGAHVRTCLECSNAVLERTMLKRSVALAGKRYVANAQLRDKIAKAVVVKKSRETGWHWRMIAVPALLALCIAVAASFYMRNESAQRQRVYSEIADLHVATLASATPVDVVSTDRHTVKPWFQGKIPFAFNLPALQGTDFTLLGGRVTYLAQTPGAQLIYQLRKHEISVFIFQERGANISGSPSIPAQNLSFNITSWTQNGLRYFVIGDAGPGDIAALAKLLRDAG